ncbi:MAG: hypothetical protein QM679_02895 [Patulibacter sp.]
MSTVASQENWRVELVLDGTSYGLFDAGDVEFGGESSTAIDPELGEMSFGGRQTGGELELSRPWVQGRDGQIYQTLKPRRQRARGSVLVHEVDPDTGQPLSSTPLDTDRVLLTSITRPGRSSGGSDAAKLSIKVQVQA